MTSERRLVERALDDAVRMARWRLLGRRTRVSRLYFQLRAEGVGWRRAHALTRRTRKAVAGVRKEPAARGVALELILA
ncbi:MAG: hypothetical protein QOJ26_1326 [Thermoplasmata archaeon]|nr:hypothetical protein [Thermoplasmata archaeon]